MIANRRQLLAGGAAAATLAALGPLAGRANAARLQSIGIQLYTVRELFQPDPVGTLQKLARIGYKEVEYGGGGYLDMDATMLRKAMDRFGLKAPALHVPYELLQQDLNGVITRSKTLGADMVICPYMTDEHRNAAAWSKAVAQMNRIGEQLKKSGLGFAYHNHDFEFTVKPDGVSLYDRMIKERDPALVKFEIDLFWAIKAGQDPKALIRRLAGSIYSYHVKDMKADGNMTSVGLGKIDFGEIFALNGVAGVKHFFVENDESPAPYIPDITTSFQTLRKLSFQPGK